MRTNIYLFTTMLLLATVNSFSQEWVVKLIQEGSEPGKISNKFPANLENEMKAFVGTKVQNINFKPINNFLFSEDFESYKGKTIIVQFGGTTCSGCKYQMPELSRIQEEYGKRNVQIIFLFPEPTDVVKKYIKDKSASGVIASSQSAVRASSNAIGFLSTP